LLHEVIRHQPYWVEDMTWGKGHIQSNSMNKLLRCKEVGNEWQRPRTIAFIVSPYYEVATLVGRSPPSGGLGPTMHPGRIELC